MTKKELDNVRFWAHIHTIQLSIEAPLNHAEFGRKRYVKDYFIRNDRLRIVINPAKYGADIRNVADLEEIMERIMGELDLNESDVRIDQVHVAIDTDTPFEWLYKLNCYVKELFAMYLNADNAYRCVGDDMRKRNTIVLNRSMVLEIYDKEQESGGYYPTRTRMEFRFKRVWKRQGMRESLERVCGILDALPRYIKALDSMKDKQLKIAYGSNLESDCEGRAIHLSEFVGRYADHIYTQSVLKWLHGRSRKGQCKHWLYRYRKSGRTLTLFPPSLLTAYLGYIQQAVRQFAQGD